MLSRKTFMVKRTLSFVKVDLVTLSAVFDNYQLPCLWRKLA